MYLNRFKLKGMSSSIIFPSILITAAMASIAALDHADSMRERLEGVSCKSDERGKTLQ